MHQHSSRDAVGGGVSQPVSHPMQSMRLPNKLLLLSLLGLWAVLGDALSLPLLFGFDLLFSSIPAFLAMIWLGPSAGLLVAALGGSATWLLWGHPYTLALPCTHKSR